MSLRVANKSCRWPNLTVPYIINDQDFPIGSANRKTVEDAIKAVNAAGANLIPRTNERDFAEFKLHPEACQSPVGRQGGYQSIRCKVGTFSKGSVMHEICHTLGLHHEHSRPDRDDFFTVNTGHSDYSGVNYDEITDAVVVDNYDFNSIMHYSISSVLGKKAGAAIPATATIGQRINLSSGDKKALTEMKKGEYLGSTYDKSSYNTIYVQSYDGVVPVTKGEIKKIVVPDNRFWWYGGSSREWVTAPIGTDTIIVFREKNTRNNNWACYNDKALNLPQKIFLGNEHDMCNNTNLYLEGLTGLVLIRKGETKTVRIANREFRWKCGSSWERSVAPPETNLIIATRASSGRAVTWACYNEVKV